MVEHKLRILQECVKSTCIRAGRNLNDVNLVLVTKEVDLDQIKEAYELGCRDFGENRVQDLVKKQPLLPEDIRWHFIGSLQTNKLKYLNKQVSLIHSCDRLELAQAIQKEAEKQNRSVDLLIQVNTSGEKTKHGFHLNLVQEVIPHMKALNREIGRAHV